MTTAIRRGFVLYEYSLVLHCFDANKTSFLAYSAQCCTTILFFFHGQLSVSFTTFPSCSFLFTCAVHWNCFEQINEMKKGNNSLTCTGLIACRSTVPYSGYYQVGTLTISCYIWYSERAQSGGNIANCSVNWLHYRLPEHVSGACTAAKYLLSAHTFFCNSLSPLRSRSAPDLPYSVTPRSRLPESRPAPLPCSVGCPVNSVVWLLTFLGQSEIFY